MKRISLLAILAAMAIGVNSNAFAAAGDVLLDDGASGYTASTLTETDLLDMQALLGPQGHPVSDPTHDISTFGDGTVTGAIKANWEEFQSFSTFTTDSLTDINETLWGTPESFPGAGDAVQGLLNGDPSLGLGKGFITQITGVDTNGSQAADLADIAARGGFKGMIEDLEDDLANNYYTKTEVDGIAADTLTAANTYADAAAATTLTSANTYADAAAATSLTAANTYTDAEVAVERSRAMAVEGDLNDLDANIKASAIYAANQSLVGALNATNDFALNLDGRLTTVEGQIGLLTGQLSGVNDRMDDLTNELRTNLAASNALSALVPNARSRGNTQISVGTGGYKDKVGIAGGLFHYIGDGTMLNAGVSYGFGKQANIGWRAGVTFGF